MTPFTIDIPQADIDHVLKKVAAYDWDAMQDFNLPEKPWAGGGNVAYLKKLCDYWLNEYDWHETQAQLNAIPNFKASVDGHEIHFLMLEGSNPNLPPLIMTHGWPGSVYEFLEVMPRIAHPEKFADIAGGKTKQGRTVICPAIPGYGFSSKPKAPLHPSEVAALWDKFMREALGHKTYVAQGGDWGSLITSYLGLNHSQNNGAASQNNGGGCLAIHLNMYGLAVPEQASNPDEIKWATRFKRVMALEGAYLQVQATKPLALGFAMMDSPVGVAAWLVEKYLSWSAAGKDSALARTEDCFTKHQIMSNIMIYLLTKSFNSASWLYAGYMQGPIRLQDGDYVQVPVGVADYGKELMSFPARGLVEVGYNVQHWKSYDKIGHFAALEDPVFFAADLQGFLDSLSE